MDVGKKSPDLKMGFVELGNGEPKGRVRKMGFAGFRRVYVCVLLELRGDGGSLVYA